MTRPPRPFPDFTRHPDGPPIARRRNHGTPLALIRNIHGRGFRTDALRDFFRRYGTKGFD